MDRLQQEPQLVQQASETEVEEALDLQQCEIEFLREQVQSLKLELRYKNQQLQEVEQELRYTNEELCVALQSECLIRDAAKQSAKEVLAEDLPTREALAVLLSVVYGTVIKPWELGKRPIAPIQLSSQKRAELDQHSAIRSRFSAQVRELRARFAALQAQTTKLKAQYDDNFKDSAQEP